MRKLFTLMLLTVLGLPVAAQVNKAEYYIDTDPGIGKAASVSVTAGTDVATKFKVPLTNIATGLHVLYVRARDAQGHWSLTASQSFYCNQISFTGANVNKAEYFIDADPGINKATAITLTPGADVSTKFTVPLAKLSAGLHVLNVRTRDSYGRWSLTMLQNFYINDLTTSQNSPVNKAEYFIDSDPGVGKATALNITSGNDVTSRVTIPLNKINPGLHVLGVRTRDALGRWSLTTQNSFFNNDFSGIGRTLVKAEYYIDNDPGEGKARPVNIAAGQTQASINFNVDLKAQSNGIHTLYARVLDSRGSWSVTNQQAFYVKNNGIEKIVSIKYKFTNAGFTSAERTYKIPVPATSVALDFNADLSDLPADKEYTMQIYAVTEGGVQTPVKTKQVKVCSKKLASAKFDIVQADYRVNFTATDTSGFKYEWDFGDGKKDSIRTVLHTYSTIGNFRVRLIVSNFCNSDTLIKTVSVSGLKSIFTDRGGNTGLVTADITGAGFNTDTKIFLNKGGQRIQGFNLDVQNDGLITATFDLDKQAIGSYDVIAIFSGNRKDTLRNVFIVETGKSNDLSISIEGSSILRIGFNQVYTITCTNNGNTDAGLVPVFIGGLPIGTNIEVQRPLFPIESVPGFDNLQINSNTNKHTFDDPISRTSYRIFLPAKLPPGATTFNVIFHVPDSTALHTLPTVVCGIGPANPDYASLVKDNATGSGTPNGLIYGSFKCAESIAESAIEDALGEIVGGKNDYTGVITCFTGDAIQKVARHYLFDEPLIEEGQSKGARILDYGDLSVGLVKQSLGCARVAGTAVGIAGAVFGNPALVTAAVKFNMRLAAAQKLVDKVADVSDKIQQVKECDADIDFRISDYLKLIIGNAIDPNELYGPGDASTQHYTNQKMLNYVVNFENKPSSNLNAQTVTVIDTLSKDNFDLSSFGFTSVTIGNSTYRLTSPAKSFIHDFDFTSQYHVKARVIAKFDTITGITNWKFLTIDPVSNQETTDALAGFLPPDIISPQGQGLVSYRIAAKTSLGTGDMVQNKAFITFDYNPVIPTNSWPNVFDMIAAKSKVETLTAITKDTSIVVKWSGSDNLSGIERYDIFYATNNGPFARWINNTSLTQANFIGKPDSTYHFYSIAYDNAGNVETSKNSAEATTTVKFAKLQTITLTPAADKTFGDADFALKATASSGLAVSYVSGNAKVLTVVSGKLHIVGAGTAIVTASQAGNGEFSAAKPVFDTIVVKKAVQKITFPSIPGKNYTDADFASGASSSSGLAISYSSSNATVLTVVNNKIHFIKPGTSTVKAYQPGNDNYLPSDTISQVIQALFTLPANNFKLSTVSESCRNSNNGEVNISAISTQNYVATITSGGTNTPHSFNKDLSVKSLPAGVYNVCITITDYPDYKQCFDVTITQPEDLSVYSVIDHAGGTISLHMEGGASFNIVLNGTTYTTDKHDITLPLAEGKNTLKVATGNACQGTFEKVFTLPVNLTAYPNPFQNTLSLAISNNHSAMAEIEVYNIHGKIVYKGKATISDGKCSIDLSALSSGVYILNLSLDNTNKRIKIFKQ